MAVPTFVAASTLVALESGNSVPVTAPAGKAVGDFLILVFFCNTNHTLTVPVTGWTQLGGANNNSNFTFMYMCRRADGTAADTPTLATTGTAASTLSGHYARMYAFRGVEPTGNGYDPFHSIPATPSTAAAVATAAINTAGPDRLVVRLVVADDDNTWASGMPPAGYTNIGGRLATTLGADAMSDGISIVVPTATTVAAVNIGTMSAADYYGTASLALIGITASTTPIGKTLQTVWNVRAKAADTLSAPWNVRARVSDTLSVPWNVRTKVAKAFSAVWDVQTPAAKTPVGKTLQVAWDVRQIVSGDRITFNGEQLTWNGETLVWGTTSLTLRWNVAAPILFQALVDPLGLVDSQSQVHIQSLQRAVPDAFGLNDQPSVVYNAVRAATDALGVADGMAYNHITVQNYVQTVSEPVALVDAAAPAIIVPRTAGDTASILDAATAMQAHQRPQTDAEGLVDTTASVVASVRSLTDLPSLADALAQSVAPQRLVTDSLALVDAHTSFQAVVRVAADAAGLVDTTTSVVASIRALAEVGNFVDSVSYEVFILTSRQQDDVLGLLDASSRLTGYPRLQAEAVGLVDTSVSVGTFLRSAAEATVLTDSWVAGAASFAILTDSAVLLDSTSRATAAVALFSEMENIVESTLRVAGFIKALADAEALADTATREVTKVFTYTDAGAFSDAFVFTTAAVRPLTELVDLFDIQVDQRNLVRLAADQQGLADGWSHVHQTATTFMVWNGTAWVPSVLARWNGIGWTPMRIQRWTDESVWESV